MSEGRERQQSLQSLERGIAVIQVFSRDRPALTLSEVARLTGITRATARRILLTLEEIGHVRSDGRLFSLTPRVLTLELALEFIEDDELVECTPEAIRLRKRLLTEADRRRADRAARV